MFLAVLSATRGVPFVAGPSGNTDPLPSPHAPTTTTAPSISGEEQLAPSHISHPYGVAPLGPGLPQNGRYGLDQSPNQELGSHGVAPLGPGLPQHGRSSLDKIQNRDSAQHGVAPLGPGLPQNGRSGLNPASAKARHGVAPLGPGLPQQGRFDVALARLQAVAQQRIQQAAILNTAIKSVRLAHAIQTQHSSQESSPEGPAVAAETASPNPAPGAGTQGSHTEAITTPPPAAGTSTTATITPSEAPPAVVSSTTPGTAVASTAPASTPPSSTPAATPVAGSPEIAAAKAAFLEKYSAAVTATPPPAPDVEAVQAQLQAQQAALSQQAPQPQTDTFEVQLIKAGLLLDGDVRPLLEATLAAEHPPATAADAPVP